MKSSTFFRILTFIVAASMTVSMFACNNGGTSETTGESSSEETVSSFGTTMSLTELTTEGTTESTTETTENSTTEQTTEQTTTEKSSEDITDGAAITESTKEDDEVTTENKVVEVETQYDPLNDPTSIIYLNKDMESFVIQGKSTRSEFFNDPYTPLQFIHFSDVHAYLENWDRVMEYANYYQDYIDFLIHTGDYVGGDQGAHTNLYDKGIDCDLEVYNCVGNHDTLPKGSIAIGSASKKITYDIIVGEHGKSWSVNFLDIENSMSYYRDFPDSNVRLIVLDLYYDIQPQQVWLRELLADAKAKGLHVITAMHQPSAEIADIPNTNFNTATDYEQLTQTPSQPYELMLSEFVQSGGYFIANLVGHTHRDYFGYTYGGVLNISVECTTMGGGWCDNDRIIDTKTQDAFNVVAVDTNLGIIKITRIGNNADNYLREKKVLCYDYINKKIVAGEGTGYGLKTIADDKYVVPASVNKYLDYRFFASRPEGATFQITDSDPALDSNGRGYTRFIGKNATGQIFWSRMGHSGNGSNWSTLQLIPMNVGKARYFVLKMRGNHDIASLEFKIGTIVGEVSYDNFENLHAAGIHIPQSKLDGEDWTVFVIDLANTMSNGWVANEDGTYNVCYLQYTFNSSESAKFTTESYFDFAYMAFVDNWNEISELVDEDQVEVITASNTSLPVDANEIKCLGEHAMSEVVNGNTYSFECSVCGTSAGSHTVPAETNRYISATKIFNYSHFQVAEKSLKSEDGLVYASFYSTQANHIHLWTASGGGGSPLDLGTNTGKYLVIKLRTDSGMNKLALTAATSGGAMTNTYNTYVTDTNWHTVVVDLENTYATYETNAPAGTTVQLRINGYLNAGSSYTIDIAYAAIVDSIDEAAGIISEDTFEFFDIWSGAPVVYETATAAPKQ